MRPAAEVVMFDFKEEHNLFKVQNPLGVMSSSAAPFPKKESLFMTLTHLAYSWGMIARTQTFRKHSLSSPPFSARGVKYTMESWRGGLLIHCFQEHRRNDIVDNGCYL